MTGVILAGGNGTRLRPLTYVANKHLLPVYNQPMIYYPLKTLHDYGCTDVIIVSGGENIGGFAELLGNSVSGMTITYKVQEHASGIAGALKLAEGLVDGVFPVILGDNYFSDVPVKHDTPTIYLKEVDDPERFGVYADGTIIEKPLKPASKSAVVGFYVFADDVFDYISTMTPSERGELEVTDINNWYLSRGYGTSEYQGYWRDMGTFDSLLEVANYVKASQ